MGDDDFADMRGSKELHGFGSLEGEGLSEYEKVVEKRAPDNSGMQFVVRCQQCGRPTTIVIPWDELLMGAAGHVPVDQQTGQPWLRDPARGGFQPPIGCRNCGRALFVMTPDECERHIVKAQKARVLPPDYVQQRIQALQAQAGRYQR